jgi:formate hydrogenlyase transcriptional activator
MPSITKVRISDEIPAGKVFTEQEMVEMEKQNIIRALELTRWKISGDDGAAALLQIPSTTLSSRIGKLKIQRK